MNAAMESRALQRFRHHLQAGGGTQLGVGPMSRACVDAVVDVANRLRLPLQLVASRRQVEALSLGGGYVEGWDTRSFVEYVRARDHGNFVVLARDHSGPWQSQHERDHHFPLEEAMESTKESLTEDLQAGMDVLHLDTSLSPGALAPPSQRVERLLELWEFCELTARRLGRTVAYEIGEEQDSPRTGREFDTVVVPSQAISRERGYTPPLFAVVQVGTFVRELSNAGELVARYRREGLDAAPFPGGESLRWCHARSTHVKVHDADYLPHGLLHILSERGVDALHVAPQMGLAESVRLIQLCREVGRGDLEQRFLELALSSGQWRKWLQARSAATAKQKALMAGHYVFHHPRFLELRAELEETCALAGIALHEDLCEVHRRELLLLLRALRTLPPSFETSWPPRSSPANHATG